MFAYSERPNTFAARKMEDNVPLEVKKRRLSEIIALQQKHSAERNIAYVGQTFEVLVEGRSKRSEGDLFGRTTHNTVVVFPREDYRAGEWVNVIIERSTAATLLGKAVGYARPPRR
jgi:tRNA-2-methylthio-N6-dimethylallyladenosine synthase